jgi:hypothetical protein
MSFRVCMNAKPVFTRAFISLLYGTNIAYSFAQLF